MATGAGSTAEGVPRPARRRPGQCGEFATLAVPGARSRRRKAAVIPGFDLSTLVDAVAARLAEHLRGELGSGGQSVRPRLLTVEQAAAYLGRSKAAVEHMISGGKVPTVRADRRVYLDVQDLDDWIREHKQAGL